MQSELGSHLPIHDRDLAAQQTDIEPLLVRIDWQPRVQFNQLAGLEAKTFTAGTKAWRPAGVSAEIKREELSLIKIAQALSGSPQLLSEAANEVLLAIRQGLSIGWHVGKQYAKAIGLFELRVSNQNGQLTTGQKAEFQEKQNSASAVTVFCAAAYLDWRLGRFQEDKLARVQVEFHGVPETDLVTPISASKCFLFYLAAYLDHSRTGLVKTDLAMVRMTLRYAEAVMAEIKARQTALKYLEPFTTVSYKYDETDFVIAGFETRKHTVAVSVPFNRVSFSDIVGNQAAKHAAQRLANRLVCYDLKRGRNPFLELGGFPMVRMGFGKPGTGKTLQISATATLLQERCDQIGLPFLFWPLPDTVISTFQGGSAERMVDWMKRLQDDDKIVYASIDDGENNLEERSRTNVSAGVREVIGVFLRYTEGAYAIIRGNTALEIFTNLPEQIDKAVLSRVQDRFPINGATSLHDFLDQDHLWWRKLLKVDPNFINMVDPSTYQYLADQAKLEHLGELDKEQATPSDERIKEIFARVGQSHEPKAHAFFAEVYAQVHQIYPYFTSRDVRNIQQAVQTRVMDFDLPECWFEQPGEFFSLEYEAKVEQLKGLMRANMGGLSFADIRRCETIRYLNAMADIANVDRERQIEALLKQREIVQAATRRGAE